MEFAPAPMVRAMLSPVGPPVAIMGMVGNFSRMALTTSGVRAAADTLSMDTPASRRALYVGFFAEHGGDYGYIYHLGHLFDYVVGHRCIYYHA